MFDVSGDVLRNAGKLASGYVLGRIDFALAALQRGVPAYKAAIFQLLHDPRVMAFLRANLPSDEGET